MALIMTLSLLPTATLVTAVLCKNNSSKIEQCVLKVFDLFGSSIMNDYRLESPPILRDFLSYHETIKAHSQKTVDEYFLDLRNFFRYLKQSRDPSLRDLPLNEISIMDVDLTL